MLAHEKAAVKAENSFIERLANQLGIAANARYIYAEAVERDGVTVIPVAKVAYAFGGGAGKKDGEEGSGGGGGVSITPVGYIEMKNGETRFRQIIGSARILTLMAIGSLSLLTVVWGVSKLIYSPERRSQ
ncbi:MAG: GerW family sporulation protein [Pyrinomonadaceae bacterium]